MFVALNVPINTLNEKGLPTGGAGMWLSVRVVSSGRYYDADGDNLCEPLRRTVVCRKGKK
jgi:hypothetical protein